MAPVTSKLSILYYSIFINENTCPTDVFESGCNWKCLQKLVKEIQRPSMYIAFILSSLKYIKAAKWETMIFASEVFAFDHLFSKLPIFQIF